MALLSQHYGGRVPGMLIKAYGSMPSTSRKTSIPSTMSNTRGCEVAPDNIPVLPENSDHGQGCNHVIYHYASQVFGSLRPANKTDKLVLDVDLRAGREPPKLTAIKDERAKRKVYDLAFDALKYQALLEDMLVDSGYYGYDTVPDENHGVIVVILCDMLNRRFARRIPETNEPVIPYVQEFEDELFAYTTKLNASLARNRIKFQARSVECLLPEKVRQREECGTKMPIYAWVNQLQNSVEEVMEQLTEDGYKKVPSVKALAEYSFAVDSQCPNVLVFDAQNRNTLEDSYLVRGGNLIIQDKSCCLGPHSVKSLLNEGDDVMHIYTGSGWTTSHLATLTNQELCTVYAFGVKNEEHSEQLMANAKKLGIHNVKFLQDNFFEVQHLDNRFKNVKVVLVTPQDSRSGVTNPVEYIIHEGADASILRELSQEQVDNDKIDVLVSKHMELLKHAMKFPRVQAVVYTTNSIFQEENENVVTKVTDYINARTMGKNPFRLIPPVLPLTPAELEMQSSSKFIKMEPSSSMGGCFLSVMSREDESMSASDVLARAAAKGLCALPGAKPTPARGDESKPKKKTSKTSQKLLPKSASAKKERKGAKIAKSPTPDHAFGATVRSPSLLVKKPSSKRLRPIRTASLMFAHHFTNTPTTERQPYGVPMTKASLVRVQPKVELILPHQEALQHPKPFL
ncbi:putative methyltransferase NSUN7 [Patiria miniata]|uniref:SAM-dependent MTase RsmB/NOP-type domain-containing protein n=1 Tax=Patiria miniata TaxID=46514 RepID=A0A913ZWT2_PATMI|nr:putative methyltransferase NSUN7 [Patiria miniata]